MAVKAESNTVTAGIGNTNLWPPVAMAVAKIEEGKVTGLSGYSHTAAGGGIL